MGHFHHHTIVVTAYRMSELDHLREDCIRLGAICTEVVSSKRNDFYHFMIAPDGSKEGWKASNEGDERREEIKWLLRGNTWVSWFEAGYGSDSGLAEIIDSKWNDS
jgi:hypothetical protein